MLTRQDSRCRDGRVPGAARSARNATKSPTDPAGAHSGRAERDRAAPPTAGVTPMRRHVPYAFPATQSTATEPHGPARRRTQRRRRSPMPGDAVRHRRRDPVSRQSGPLPAVRPGVAATTSSGDVRPVSRRRGFGVVGDATWCRGDAVRYRRAAESRRHDSTADDATRPVPGRCNSAHGPGLARAGRCDPARAGRCDPARGADLARAGWCESARGVGLVRAGWWDSACGVGLVRAGRCDPARAGGGTRLARPTWFVRGGVTRLAGAMRLGVAGGVGGTTGDV